MVGKSTSKIPVSAESSYSQIIKIIKKFCDDKLNKEYFELASSLTAKLARKRPSPLLSGKKTTWAAGVIHALGMVNFLFDSSQNPYISSKEISTWFNLGASTISGKSKMIRDMFKIYQMDPKWTLPSKLNENPKVWMISVNGFILDVRAAPYDIQLQAYEAGLIPYIPNDQK